MEVSPIRKLDEAVIKQIAAGEIIQRPINVVKELIENSIDAGSSRITIKIEAGGYSLIKIEDDGSGIRYKDLPNACKRHFSSKIRQFSDLLNLSTFGFRGEALYSMSCCAHLSITTKTSDADIGYYAQYEDGELIKPIETSYAVNGTIVEIRELFYKDPIRIQEKSKSNDERKRIQNLILNYSVVYPHIAFIFLNNEKEMYRSLGDSTFDIVLRTIYSCDDPDAFFQLNFPIEFDSKTGNAELFLSSPGNSKAPSHSAIFINGRLITNIRIRQAIENIYTDFLARGCHPFFFCVLTVPPELVDVNIHPSKKEVLIDDESNVISQICLQVKQALQKRSSQRGVQLLTNSSPKRKHKQAIPANQQTISFQDGKMQMQAPQSIKIDNRIDNEAVIEISNESDNEPHNELDSSKPDEGEKPLDNHSNNETIIDYGNKDINIESEGVKVEEDKPFIEKQPNFAKTFLSDDDNDDEGKTDFVTPKLFTKSSDLPAKAKKPRNKFGNINIFEDLKYEPKIPKDPKLQTLEQVLTKPQVSIPKYFIQVNLPSIKSLREQVDLNQDERLTNFFKECEFVGFTGLTSILFRNSDKLYAFNLFSLIKDFIYQRLLAYFQNYTQQRMNPPINIADFIELEMNEGESEIKFDFAPHAAMLDDYFSISIQDGILYSLPKCITGYSPSLSGLPLFLKKLAQEIDWEDEIECLGGLINELSNLYSVMPQDEDDRDLMKKMQNEIVVAILPLLKSDDYKPSKDLWNCHSVCEIPIL